MSIPSSRTLPLDRARLRRMRLPEPDSEGDKEDRGRVLVIGGGAAVPGAIVLAGIAALRAGAGKLQLATTRDASIVGGMTVPEAMVIPLPAGRTGEIAPNAFGALKDVLEHAHAVLIGPGMLDERACRQLLERMLPALRGATLVIDAGALAELGRIRRKVRDADADVILTPHAGEMARLLGVTQASVEADALGMAQRAADEFGATVALKGAETFVVQKRGTPLRYDGGTIGLATSGSGDTLAGVVTGLAARGADPLRATAWGVYLHGAAGQTLARRVGRLGYLARELLDEIPAEIRRVAGGRRGSR
jgi:ADP-dependent NAD(P)H-hydrate dehydratase